MFIYTFYRISTTCFVNSLYELIFSTNFHFCSFQRMVVVSPCFPIQTLSKIVVSIFAVKIGKVTIFIPPGSSELGSTFMFVRFIFSLKLLPFVIHQRIAYNIIINKQEGNIKWLKTVWLHYPLSYEPKYNTPTHVQLTILKQYINFQTGFNQTSDLTQSKWGRVITKGKHIYS